MTKAMKLLTKMVGHLQTWKISRLAGIMDIRGGHMKCIMENYTLQ